MATQVQPVTRIVAPIGIGWFIALLVLIAVFVLVLTGKMDTLNGLLIGGLAVARLIA